MEVIVSAVPVSPLASEQDLVGIAAAGLRHLERPGRPEFSDKLMYSSRAHAECPCGLGHGAVGICLEEEQQGAPARR
jgi:hypothetical protein